MTKINPLVYYIGGPVVGLMLLGLVYNKLKPLSGTSAAEITAAANRGGGKRTKRRNKRNKSIKKIYK